MPHVNKAHLAYRESDNLPKSEYSDYRVDRVTAGGTLFQYSCGSSGARIGMETSFHHSSITLTNPTKRTQLSGVELDYYNSTFRDIVEAENPVKVVDVIPKYQVDGLMILKNPELYVVYQDIVTNRIGITIVESFKSDHAIFGYSMRPNKDILDNLEVGSILTPKTALNRPPSQLDDGNYGLGRETLVASIGSMGTNEDSGIAAESVKEDFKSEQYDTIEIFIDNGKYLLDIFGKGGPYKPIPSLGETVKDMGLIAAVRNKVNRHELFHRIKESMSTLRTPFDTPYYSKLNCEVVDIDIIRPFGKPMTNNCPSGQNQYLDSVWNKGLARYHRVLELDRQFTMEMGKGYPRSTMWHAILREALLRTDRRVNRRTSEPTPTINDMPVTGYYIKLIVKSVVHPNLGHKFTGLHGEKYVISEFRKDEDMFTDQWGRTAQFVTNPDSIIGRNIPGMIFEPYGSDALFHLHLKVQRTLKSEGPKAAEAIYLAGMKVISTKTHHIITTASPENYLSHLNYVLYEATGLQRVDEVGDVSLSVLGVANIMKSDFRPPKGKLTFRNYLGEMEETRGEHRISTKTILALDKIGSYTSACAVPPRTVAGFPKKVNSREKRNTQVNEQSNKDTGESENRDKMATMRPEAVVMLARLGMSSKANREALEQIADGCAETDIDTSGLKSRGVELLHSETYAWGFRLTNKKSKYADKE